ncbi:aryl sulfate ester ABC transporter [Planctomycetota bacterium]|nr:aryl sulfate ester ABC transporter [Planctomycetota bacterium]
MNRLAILFALVLVAVDGQAGDHPAAIRIGFASAGLGGRPFTSSGVLAIVHVKSLLEEEFKAENIRIDWHLHKGAGPAVNEALAGGLLDLTTQGDLPSLLGRSSGIKTRIILATSVRANTYLAVPVDSPAKRLEDLKGKRVAYHRGTNATLGIAKLLHSRGLSDADFRTINLDSTAAQVALTNHDIEGAWGSLLLFDLVKRGVARIIDGTRGGDPRNTLQSSILVTESFATAYPSIVQRIVDVLVRTARWQSDPANRSEVFAAWAKSGYAADILEEDYQGDLLRVRSSPLLDEFFTSQYRDGARLALAFKLIRNPVEVDGWFDPRYLSAALKKQNLEEYWLPAAADGSFGTGSTQPTAPTATQPAQPGTDKP